MLLSTDGRRLGRLPCGYRPTWVLHGEGTCQAPGVLVSKPDKHGQENWELTVHRALRGCCLRQSFSLHLSIRSTGELCKNTGVHTPRPEGLNQLVWGGAQA